MQNGIQNQIPFKDFLDKCAGLFTIFGILNGLIIFSNSIDNKYVAITLSVSLYLLSLIVGNEILAFAIRSKNDSAKYSYFILFFLIIECSLAYYFYTLFEFQLKYVAIWYAEISILSTLWLILTLLLTAILTAFTVSATSSRLSEKSYRNAVIIISAILAAILIYALVYPRVDQWIR
jgi:hypothetical protein